MSALTQHTRYAMVRHGFTEECEWRAALGGSELLRVAVTDGPIDAPDWIPAGSTIPGGRYDPIRQSHTLRDGHRNR